MKEINSKKPNPQEVAADKEELDAIEKVISKGKNTFVAVGLGLERIRQSRIYRHWYDTFEDYCQKKWGWTSRRGRQLINSALVAEEVTKQMGTTVPISECAVRELSKVPKEDRAEVLTSVSKNGPVTAKAIISQADARLYTSAKNVDAAKEKPPEERKDAIGRIIPNEILPEWDRASEVGSRLRKLASEIKVTVERGLADKDVIFAEITNPTISEAAGLHYTLSQIFPHSVCPACQGKLRNSCQLCRKRGWISKFLFNSPAVSADTRALLEKVAAKGGRP